MVKVTRLRPVQIALMPLPGQPGVTVELATDDQFQQFVDSTPMRVLDGGIAEWSFDDRCGVINCMLRCDLFRPVKNNSTWELKRTPSAEENNSEPEQKPAEKPFPNSSETIPSIELFDAAEPALKVLVDEFGEMCGLMITNNKNSSQTEQKTREERAVDQDNTTEVDDANG